MVEYKGNITDVVEVLRQFVKHYDEVTWSLAWAKSHIMENLDKFTDKELKCMVADGILRDSDIQRHSDAPGVPEVKGTKVERERLHHDYMKAKKINCDCEVCKPNH